jgi:UDP-arabinose 4-epimerase
LTERTIVVTGGAGYVGSHACKALAAAGYVPVCYDNLVHGHERAVRWGPFERGDLLDSDRLLAVLRRYRASAVMHFAAYCYVGESVTAPLEYYRNNVAGTVSLLAAMREAQIERLVVSSTCAVYGVPASRGLIDEERPQHPVNPYGHSKRMMEQVVRDASEAYGLRAVMLRYFNAAGADADGEIGEDHDPETHLIPLVLDAASESGASVTVFGADYPTPDGTCIRDYVHVEDLADAHVLGLKYMEASPGVAAFNLGTGRGYSVREIIDAARRVTGREPRIVEGPRRPGDPPALVADATRARDTLGWQPRWVDIERIIETAWRWRCRNAVSNPETDETGAQSVLAD